MLSDVNLAQAYKDDPCIGTATQENDRLQALFPVAHMGRRASTPHGDFAPEDP